MSEGTVAVGSNSTTGATVAVAVATDTGISSFGRLWFYCFQQAKRERALGSLNGALLHESLIASHKSIFTEYLSKSP